MLIREAIQRVQEVYNKGVPSDDSRMSNRYIYSKLRSTRIVLLTRKIKKKQKVSQWSYQTLPCVELIIAPQHECPCVPYDGCMILRSKYKLPEIFTDMNRHLIQTVAKIDNSVQFTETTWNAVKLTAGNRFAKLPGQYYIHNGYLYITNTKKIALATVVALFNDPIAAYTFEGGCINVNDCKSHLDFEFPFDGEMEEALIELAKEEILAFTMSKEDIVNNSNDDSFVDIRRTQRIFSGNRQNNEQEPE